MQVAAGIVTLAYAAHVPADSRHKEIFPANIVSGQSLLSCPSFTPLTHENESHQKKILKTFAIIQKDPRLFFFINL